MISLSLTVLNAICVCLTFYALVSSVARVNFDHDLLVQRYFLQVGRRLHHAEKNCSGDVGAMIRGWDRKTKAPLLMADFDTAGLTEAQISLEPPNQMVVRVDGEVRKFPLQVVGCGIDRARARLDLAGFIVLDEGRRPTSPSIFLRCPRGEYLTRQVNPLDYACLTYEQ